MERRNAHLNLVHSSQRLFELDPGVEIEAGPGWLFGAGSAPHPTISNAAFRVDDALDPSEFLERADAFFTPRGRGFSAWARGGEPADRDLIAAAGAAGLEQVYAMPEMVLGGRAEERPLPEGVELRRVRSAAEADDYWRVAAAAYASLGFPPEVFGFYKNHDGLLGDDVAAFLAYLGGRPVAIAMTIVSHGVAGVYWVGTIAEARGRGLGRALTAAATNAGFDLGAEIASLQASPLGEPIYAAMGYEAIYEYRLLMSAAPQGRRRKGG